MAQVHCGSRENLRIYNLWGSLPSSPSSSCLGTLSSKKIKSRFRVRVTLAGSQRECGFYARFVLPWELATTSWSLSLGGRRLQSEMPVVLAQLRRHDHGTTALAPDADCPIKD